MCWSVGDRGDRVGNRRVGAVARRARVALASAALACALSISMLAGSPASGAVLRIAHRTAVAACTYARAHGSARSRQAGGACARLLSSTPAARAAAASFYQNPISGATADPAGLDNNGSGSDYYLYATGNLFPIQHSDDLVHWTAAGTALLSRPSWVVHTGDWNPWAPSVLQVPRSCPDTTSPTCYIMYYVGKSARFSVHCVAEAVSTTPNGPFTDRGPLSNGQRDAVGRPIGCGDNTGYGNIDPAPFVDDDTAHHVYLYVSTDRSCPAASTSCTSANSTLKPTISVLRLHWTALGVSGTRVPLFSGDLSWEKAPWAWVVEGPWMEKRYGYHLFYSGGAWTGDYKMGVALLDSPTGPARKYPNPVLQGTSTVFGPGGGSTITGPDGLDWMLYHARLGGYSQPRQLFIDPLVWNGDGSVQVAGPTTTMQSPAP